MPSAEDVAPLHGPLGIVTPDAQMAVTLEYFQAGR
jgi:hypothetical protein